MEILGSLQQFFPLCEFLGFLRYLFLFGPAHVILKKFLQDAEDTELRILIGTTVVRIA